VNDMTPMAGSLPGRATLVGLELPENLTEAEWQDVGRALHRVERSVMWCIGDWWTFGERRYGERKRLVTSDGWDGPSYGTCRDAAWVAERFRMSDRSDKVSWMVHRALAAVEDADERRALLRQAEAEGWTVREAKAQASRRRAAKAIGACMPGEGTCTVADLWALVDQGRRFGCIYADPPWLYDNQATEAAMGNHYAGMSVEELAELPVGELAAPDAHLHVWTTNAFRRACYGLFDAWGFKDKSEFAWCKDVLGMGNYFRNSHEVLLTAVRGNATRFNDHTLRSWQVLECGQHSEKPAVVRDWLRRASPGPYLELFGRRPVEGWTVWGDQIERAALLAEPVEEDAA
jgi:N6-adenosine-specific RNA methylase IME4